MKASHLNDKTKATIRKATADDLAGIVELCAAHAAFEDMTFDPSGLQQRLAEAIGRRLFDAVAEEARSTGISNVEWQTPARNTDAIDFYHSLGATDKVKARFNLCLNKSS